MTKNEFFTNWIKSFASDIPQKDINRYLIGFGGYIWHTFSWKLIDEKQYLVGDAARKAYDKLNKKGALYLEWFEDEQTKEINWPMNTSKELDKLIEVYAAGKDFEWTYIKTHEYDFGPYFMMKNNRSCNK